MDGAGVERNLFSPRIDQQPALRPLERRRAKALDHPHPGGRRPEIAPLPACAVAGDNSYPDRLRLLLYGQLSDHRGRQMETVPDAVRGRVFGIFVMGAGVIGNLSHWMVGAKVKQLGAAAYTPSAYFPSMPAMALLVPGVTHRTALPARHSAAPGSRGTHRNRHRLDAPVNMNLPNYFLADLPPEATLSATMIGEACQTLKRNRVRYLGHRSTHSLIHRADARGARLAQAELPVP